MSALSDTYFTIYQTNTHEKRVGSEHVEEQVIPKRQKYSQYVPSGVKSIFLAKDVMMVLQLFMVKLNQNGAVLSSVLFSAHILRPAVKP
jgi:hypothetical protein